MNMVIGFILRNDWIVALGVIISVLFLSWTNEWFNKEYEKNKRSNKKEI